MTTAGDYHRVQLACEAMRARFELVLVGDDPAHLRAAGEECLAEIRRIEKRLNYFDPNSDLSRINRETLRGPIALDAEFFDLLLDCRRWWKITGGLFDPTVAPMRAGQPSDSPAAPNPPPLVPSSFDAVELDAINRTIRFHQPSLRLNFGAVGKGFALDRVAELLRELQFRHALIHGGTSSTLAIGDDPAAPTQQRETDRELKSEDGWKIGIANPDRAEALLGSVTLKDAALGVSSNILQMREHGSPHILNPTTGQTASIDAVAAVIAPSAAAADALSTALLVSGNEPPVWLNAQMRALRFERRQGLWTKTLDVTG